MYGQNRLYIYQNLLYASLIFEDYWIDPVYKPKVSFVHNCRDKCLHSN